MQDLKAKLVLNPRHLSLAKVLIGVFTVGTVLMTCVSLGYTCKNLTYTTRFTPPSMRSFLQDNSVYLYSQLIILVSNVLLVFTECAQWYGSLKLRPKLFLGVLAGNLLVWAGSLAGSIMFQVGGSEYRGILKFKGFNLGTSTVRC